MIICIFVLLFGINYVFPAILRPDILSNFLTINSNQGHKIPSWIVYAHLPSVYAVSEKVPFDQKKWVAKKVPALFPWKLEHLLIPCANGLHVPLDQLYNLEFSKFLFQIQLMRFADPTIEVFIIPDKFFEQLSKESVNDQGSIRYLFQSYGIFIPPETHIDIPKPYNEVHKLSFEALRNMTPVHLLNKAYPGLAQQLKDNPDKRTKRIPVCLKKIPLNKRKPLHHIKYEKPCMVSEFQNNHSEFTRHFNISPGGTISGYLKILAWLRRLDLFYLLYSMQLEFIQNEPTKFGKLTIYVNGKILSKLCKKNHSNRAFQKFLKEFNIFYDEKNYVY